MLFHKSSGEVRRSIAPAQAGALLFMLLLLAIAAWSWLGGDDREGAAEIPSPALMDVSQIPAPADKEDIAPEQPAAVAAEAYFAAYRMEREESRAGELTQLEAIISDPASSETAVAAAEQRRLELSAAGGYELQAESLLEAKGFGQTVVIIGESIATVIVDVEMDGAKAARIAEAVDGVCGCGFENVVVVNR